MIKFSISLLLAIALAAGGIALVDAMYVTSIQDNVRKACSKTAFDKSGDMVCVVL